MKEKYIKWSLITFVWLIVLSLVLMLFFPINSFESMRIVFGSVYVLFLPGFLISFIFFPKTEEFDSKNKDKDSIDWIERIAFSFALSIAIVPLAVFYLNLIGVRINLLSSSLTILGILLISAGILYWRQKRSS